MSKYQVLARKYRPKDFSQLLGQSHVSQALSHAIDTGRLHHAYLFTGTRGVGKTTIARILAKCLNCETGITSQPCGVCDTCVSVDEGRFIDLIEIDAASRTKVEDTRDLLENVPYAPTQGRYKVYLIDEVHMLSTHSFNALLKTLEEPPEHVKFILATTDPQKLPITIVSRCLQFVLRPMSQELLYNHLSKILQLENTPFEDGALWQLAQSAKGSVRDALSLTDQAIAFGGGQLKSTAVIEMLGLVDNLDVLDLIDDIYHDHRPKVAQHITRLREQMVDATALLDRLVDSLHQMALVQILPNLPLDMNDTQKQAFYRLAHALPADVIQLYYEICLKSRESVRLASTPMQALEMAILRLLAFRPLGGDELVINNSNENYLAPEIENSEIENSEIENSEIENSEIENSEIENSEIENSEIENSEIENSEIENSEIENSEIENSEIENSEIENSEIENSEIENSEIENSEIENSEIENSEIENSEIENSEIENSEIENSEIENSEIENSEIENSEIENSEIENSEIENSEIENSEIENSEIENSEIENSEIENSEIENSEIENSEIENSEIENSEIENSEIENSEIENSEIENSEIENSEIENSEIENSEIENSEIENLPTSKKKLLQQQLLAPQVHLTGQWTAEKWDYWLSQARQNKTLTADELALCSHSVMTGDIDGQCRLYLHDDNEQIRFSFRKFCDKFATLMPNSELNSKVALMADLNQDEIYEVPYDKQQHRQQAVIAETQNQIINSPTLQRLWQGGYIEKNVQSVIAQSKLLIEI